MPRSDAPSLWRLLRAHPRRTAGVTALLTLAGVSEGIGLLALLPLLESVSPGGGEGSRTGEAVMEGLRLLGVEPSLGGLFAVIGVALLAKGVLRWIAMARVGAEVAAVGESLRLRLLRALFAARWSHFAGQSAGRAAAALSRETLWAALAYRDACAALAAALQLAVYAGAVMLVSWKLGLLALVGGIAASAPLGAWIRVSRRAGGLQSRHTLALLGRLVDVLQAMKPIRAMGRETAFLEALAEEARALRRAEESHVRATEALRALQEPLLAALVLAILFASLTAGGESLPTLLVFAVLLQRMVGRFHALQSEYQAAVAAGSAYRAVEEQIAEAERSRAPGGGSAPAPSRPPAVELHRLAYRRGDRALLDDVSLSIPSGAFVAVVGASGAGKTTLLDLVAGLREPDAGEVRLDGVPLGTIERDALRRGIGYVPQEGTLLNDSVLANVLLGHPGSGERSAARALAEAGAEELLARLPGGLRAEVGERGLRLSGGERRRVALARALLGRPRLLLLDEATSELDRDSAAAIGRALRALRGRMTIVAVTHHPALAAAADEVYALSGGRLLRELRPEMVPLAVD